MLPCGFNRHFFMNKMDLTFISLNICISVFENSCLCLLLGYYFPVKEIFKVFHLQSVFKNLLFVFILIHLFLPRQTFYVVKVVRFPFMMFGFCVMCLLWSEFQKGNSHSYFSLFKKILIFCLTFFWSNFRLIAML